MANFEEIREKIDERITALGLTYRDVSLKIGRKDSYIQQYVKYGFPKRLKEVDRKKVAVVLGMDEKELVDDELMVDVLDGELVYKDEVSGKIFDFFNLGIYGLGGNCIGEKLVGKLMFDKHIFNDLISEEDNLKVIRYIGDDMQGLIDDKSLVVFDVNKNRFMGDGVYVIKIGENFFVKRLQFLGEGEFMVISDNKQYESWIVSSDKLVILGKVKGVFNWRMF
ncbi:MAG: LexA family transcriptional regulator [Alphaproteobacteria bacterium]|nr:LexA family transcriptional regulator [Alphaproteobacteria bacterium]